MAQHVWSPAQLRDLHLKLALEFEAEANTTDDGFDIDYFRGKCEEAFDGALHFERLHFEGVREVTRAQP